MIRFYESAFLPIDYQARWQILKSYFWKRQRWTGDLLALTVFRADRLYFARYLYQTGRIGEW